MQRVLSRPSVEEASTRLDRCSPIEIVEWTLSHPSLERIAVASAFQAEGTALIDMVYRIRPGVPILFVNTGFHFAETLAFVRTLTDLLRLNVIEVVPPSTVDESRAREGRLYERDPDQCCELNKVSPFREALSNYDAWMTSMRRDSAWTRANVPVVSRTRVGESTLVKINPMANWSRADVWRYLSDRDLPHHPLYDLGYPSIGCAPCTRAVAPGEDERSGRWSGLVKTECGIHVAGFGRTVSAEPGGLDR
jgi:phosphoadenosine phosphosulfate reductase